MYIVLTKQAHDHHLVIHRLGFGSTLLNDKMLQVAKLHLNFQLLA